MIGRLRIFLLSLALATLASWPARGATVPELDRAPRDVPRADSPVTVDGILDEAAWSRALVVELPYEVDPAENEPAPVRTECLLAYGDRELYVAFRAHDPEPARIRSHLIDRDRAWRDDLVGFVVDPFNDERRGFLFLSNPAGVQMDASVNEVGGSNGEGFKVAGLPGEDLSWDAIWSSAGRITAGGYEVEMAVPYTSLRFQRIAGIQTWGFAAFRFHPRNVRRKLLSVPLERGANCTLCQFGKIRGFENASPGRNLELVPTLTGLRHRRREDGATGPGPVDTRREAGLSARWGVTPNLNLNAALNPDFSQVEADVAQLDVNTRFALFFPEKRPFFLEGADFFDTPIQAVFTRTVADPSWGLKFSGKEGRNAIGVFVARDDRPPPARANLILPGNERSVSTVLDDEVLTAVTRYRRDFGSSSTLGVLYTDREAGDYHNRVGGLDGVLRFTSSDALSFQMLHSDTFYPATLARDQSQPTTPFGDHALVVQYGHDTRNWSVGGAYQDLGAGFRADAGFVPRVDLRSGQVAGEMRWWGEAGDPFTLLSVGFEADRVDDHDSMLSDQDVALTGRYEGPLQSLLTWRIAREKERFEGVLYDQSTQSFFLNIRPTGDFTSSLGGSFGDVVDFENGRPAREVHLEPGITWDRGHVNVQFDHTFERLTVDGGELFTANLSQLRLVYNFNVRTFVRGIFQFLNLRRDPDLFLCTTDPVAPCELAPRERTLFTQLLFSYKLNPQTVVFLGYSEDRTDDGGGALETTGRTVFVKLGYAWVM